MRIKESALLGYLFILPITVWLVIFLVYPTILVFYLSFTDQRVLGGSAQFIGVEPYLKVLSDSKTHISILNTLYWLIGNLIVVLLGGLGGALILNQKFKGKWLVRSIILLPWMVPTVAVAMIWHWMLSAELGVINHWLVKLGILQTPIVLFGSTENAMLTCILVNAWRFIPFNILLIFAALQTIPEEHYEAAKIDGASPIQIFRYITLPSLSGILSAVTLLSIIWVINYFDLPWLLTRGGPSLATETIPIRLYRLSFHTYEFSSAAALSVILFIALILFAAVYIRRAKPF